MSDKDDPTLDKPGAETFRLRIGNDTDISGTIMWDGANWKAQGNDGEFPFYKDNRSLAIIGHLCERLSPNEKGKP